MTGIEGVGGAVESLARSSQAPRAEQQQTEAKVEDDGLSKKSLDSDKGNNLDIVA